MTIAIRPATAADFEKFFKRPAQHTVRALAGEKEGRLVGLGGVAYEGARMIVFSNFDETLSKREIVQGARAIMEIVEAVEGPIYARAEDTSEARRTLMHFGFTDLGDGYFCKWGGGA